MTIDQSLQKIATELPKLYLGQEVRTNNGRGIIVRLSLPTSEQFIYPQNTIIDVWYGVDDKSGEGVSEIFGLENFMQELANNPQP